MNRWLLILIVVTAMAYQGISGAGFVWDDIPLIVQNQALDEASTATIFGSDLWADSGAGEVASGYYRPLVLLSFVVDRILFGLNPLGYHIHSLCWHLLAVVGFFRLARTVMGARGGLLAAAVFALHPVQSEVVVWIAARNDLMAAAFGFFALGCVWGGKRPCKWSWCGAMALTVLAGLSKETAFVLPALLLTSDLARSQRDGMWHRVSALVVGVGLVLLVRVIVGVGEGAVPSVAGWSLLFSSLASWLGVMGAAIVNPWPISSARDLTWLPLVSSGRVLLGLLFWLGLGAVAWFASGERRRIVWMGCAWVVLLLGVTLVPIADKGGFGDRFLYWPMAGIGMVVGVCCVQWWKPLIPLFVLPAMLILHLRIPDWAHDRSLWGTAIRDVPTPTNELSLGHALTLHSRHKRAHVNFTSAMVGNQIDIEACAPIVGSAMRAGLHAHALRMGEWAIARGCPKSGLMNGWMATAAAMTGEWSLAEQWAFTLPDDPKGRSRVVRAALARRAGDDEEYARIDAQWAGLDYLDSQVNALLQAGEPELMER
jgi:hypothetical protein